MQDFDVKKVQHGFKIGGAVLAAASALMTAMFGWSLASNWFVAMFVAGALVVASLASAYVWIIVGRAAMARNWALLTVAAIGGILFTTTDATTNFGSVATQRGTNVQRATVQNVRYDDARDRVEEAKRNLVIWTKQLEDLQASEPWTATVKADGLRAQLAAADLAIEQESKRGGCGPRCLALTKEKGTLEDRIAKSELREDLTKRITATKNLVDKYRDVAATTEKAESAAVMQTTALAGTVTLSLDPSDVAMAWTDRGVAMWVALFLTLGPAILNFLGFMPLEGVSRRLGVSSATIPAGASVPAVQPSQNTVHESTVVITEVDEELRRRLAEQEARSAKLNRILAAYAPKQIAA